VRNVGNQVGFEAFALHFLLKGGFKTGTDVVESLCQRELRTVKFIEIKLIAGLPGGELADGIADGFLFACLPEQYVKDPQVKQQKYQHSQTCQQVNNV